MLKDESAKPAYVVKPDELLALNYLPDDCPRPRGAEWINRKTSKPMQQSAVAMLFRTLHLDSASPSVKRLRRTSGLRIYLADEARRIKFARAFSEANKELASHKDCQITAIFGTHAQAEKAVERLTRIGVPKDSIALLFQARAYMDTDFKWPEGHGALSIAGAMSGGGLVGTAFALALLTIPAFGPVAAAGAIAATALQSAAAAGGILGATGGAVARMLTDHDVDGVSAIYYQEQIRRGKTFLSVDIRTAGCDHQQIRAILTGAGGSHHDAA